MWDWRPPEKVCIATEAGISPATFEFNGVMPDGIQVMAYPYVYQHQPYVSHPDYLRFKGGPASKAAYSWYAVVHRFDADGRHLSTRSRRRAGRAAQECFEEAQSALREMLAPFLAGGWRAADIRVRPFCVSIDDLTHGLIFMAEGGPETEEDRLEMESVYFAPYGYRFGPPYEDGQYSS
jgi:hypothetical protein